MKTDNLTIDFEPKLTRPRLVMGLSGWMDSGDVSTGTIRYIRKQFETQKFASIQPEGFYIYNFPGSMDISALFRPNTKINSGLVQSLDMPTNTFYVAEKQDLILFSGKEPNLNWEYFADCIFALCSRLNIHELFFVGSFAGLTPHTREPRMTFSMSDEKLKTLLPQQSPRLSSYEGPAGFSTYMTSRASKEGFGMLNIVAEVPAYVQGYNPRCIETATRYLCRLLDIQINLDDLIEMGDEFEKKLVDILRSQPELATKITELEEDYDNQVFDTQMGDLKEWLQQKGIRLD